MSLFFEKVKNMAHLNIDVFYAIHTVNEGSFSRITQLIKGLLGDGVLV
jgi:hypothetical protein